jgi:hypothetical protein
MLPLGGDRTYRGPQLVRLLEGFLDSGTGRAGRLRRDEEGADRRRGCVGARSRGPVVRTWLRRRQEAQRLARADAAALIHDHGAEAYREAREWERDVVLADGQHAGRAANRPI